MRKKLFLFLLSFFSIHFLSAQLEGIKVETYYVSDANDATDTDGGGLEEGSVTYRIYVDMLPGSKLKRIYGDDNHPLVFSSTAPFFNNDDRPEVFGKDVRESWLDDNTVALDTWLTLGLATRNVSGDSAYFAIPKEKDTDGSIVGGENNDGGSEGINGGLLVNSTAEMGLPLTEADGLILAGSAPTGWSSLIGPLGNPENTIFGASTDLEFVSNSAALENSGTMGAIPADNEVLVAQLTTKGEITFQLNLEIEFEEDGVVKVVKYVGDDDFLASDEVFNPLLNYPWTCGCTDPNFLEASTEFACEDNSLCLTPIVYGCLDSMACNYDPAANFNIEDLCCYVGYCNDRDISIVCPELPTRRLILEEDQIKIFPNPTRNFLNITLPTDVPTGIPFEIYDALGRQKLSSTLTNHYEVLDISQLKSGLYYIHFSVDGTILTKAISIF